MTPVGSLQLERNENCGDPAGGLRLSLHLSIHPCEAAYYRVVNLIAWERVTTLKRPVIALVAAGISLVLILYLRPTRSQQPVAPSKPHKITVSWNSVPRAVSYNVYRRPYRVETYTKVGTSNTNSYEDPAVQSGERYCYVVTSIDSKGNESPRPKEICLTVPRP